MTTAHALHEHYIFSVVMFALHRGLCVKYSAGLTRYLMHPPAGLRIITLIKLLTATPTASVAAPRQIEGPQGAHQWSSLVGFIRGLISGAHCLYAKALNQALGYQWWCEGLSIAVHLSSVSRVW